jgi:hypothetical protein
MFLVEFVVFVVMFGVVGVVSKEHYLFSFIKKPFIHLWQSFLA